MSHGPFGEKNFSCRGPEAEYVVAAIVTAVAYIGLEHPGLTAAAESGQGGEDDQAARALTSGSSSNTSSRSADIARRR